MLRVTRSKAVLDGRGEAAIGTSGASYRGPGTLHGEKYGSFRVRSVNYLWDLQRREERYQTSYLRDLRVASGCTRALTSRSAPLSPPSPPTVDLEHTKSPYPGYRAAYNVLDYSVAVVCAGRPDGAQDLRVETSNLGATWAPRARSKMTPRCSMRV
ncbi:hypothetical protein MYCTH_2129411 [Thermothelomyces thermophilus ATCC 42464]|uniref:Uncharacterized protein n=1 Tax=Thermothelomyces thermophilus (strain ATCC 42464 / BCRC 31852 / DSM 1799) TaxID=573729 RepID=G2QIE5_THET4|nr:uncharacterized protein MYCTH_2129411 [Thermothelomyces thermophilus ATCC 42464]AEO60319.1 hypothetical protein MYCTH_2129411 [Thermothelomyces thermophilus ATCC 42464]